MQRTHDEQLELTVDNVNAILEEVRPYLLADGGNVAVDSIDLASRDVNLILEGACSGCPSSTTTMRMGIERVLRETRAAAVGTRVIRMGPIVTSCWLIQKGSVSLGTLISPWFSRERTRQWRKLLPSAAQVAPSHLNSQCFAPQARRCSPPPMIAPGTQLMK